VDGGNGGAAGNGGDGGDGTGSSAAAGGAAGTGTGLNTLNVESGGAVTVVNGTTSFGLTRNAGPTSVTNLSGTLTAPRVINLASTGTLNFTGGTLKANGLKEVEKISEISARLIVNQAALKTRPQMLKPLMETFARAARERAA
jgi:hypothetical protein